MSRLVSIIALPFRLYAAALTDVLAYPEMLKLSRRARILSLILLYAIFSLALTANFSWRVLPRWQSDWRQSWENIQQNWPNDMVVEYRAGQLSVSPEQVFVLPYPAPLAARPGLPANFARVDTREQPENPRDSLLFINRDSLTAETAVPLVEIFGTSDWRIDKSTLLPLGDQVTNSLTAVARTLITLHFFFGWIGLLLIRLVGLVFYAWVAQAFFYLARSRSRYGQVYGLGMIALLPAETAQIFINLLYPDHALPLFWWAWLAIMGLVAWVNRKQKSS